MELRLLDKKYKLLLFIWTKLLKAGLQMSSNLSDSQETKDEM